MNSSSVIKTSIYSKNLRFGVGLGFEFTVMGEFRFQSMEEAFGNSIIPAIPFSANTLNNTMVLQDGSVTIRGVLTAPIRMPNKLLKRFSLPNCHPGGVIN
jgi:hypothetical protein